MQKEIEKNTMNFVQSKTIISSENISQHLSTNFLQLEGFDYKWNSLITNTPLLFEDIDYLRVKPFITETITDDEVIAYKSQNLRELYATFENMLICNLQYYDRIISFCTIEFLKYVRVHNDRIKNLNENENHTSLESNELHDLWTPTRIWCCALANTSSTKWELEYAFQNNLQSKLENKSGFEISSEISVFQTNFELIYQSSNSFAKMLEYRAAIIQTNGFRETYLNDKTSNKKLSQVCNKFTRTSIAITETELSTIIEYIEEQSIITSKLYTSLHECMMNLFENEGLCPAEANNKFAIYVFNHEFYIHTQKFSIKVYRDELGKITKDYLANSYECFLAEEKLFPSIRTQIEWAKYKLPKNFEHDKRMLTTVLLEMLRNYYRDIICIKRMNEYGILSKISFTGVFDNIHVYEEFMFENRCIKSEKKCMSKENAAKYVVERGYYIFGLEKDVFEKLSEIRNLQSRDEKNIFISHYINYCIPVMTHMRDVMLLHTMSKNEIIDIYCGKPLNPLKLNNKNIVYVERDDETLKDRMRQHGVGENDGDNNENDLDHREIMQNILKIKENPKMTGSKFKYETGKKNYWGAIE